MFKMLGKLKKGSKAIFVSVQVLIVLIIISTFGSFALFNIQKQKAIDNFYEISEPLVSQAVNVFEMWMDEQIRIVKGLSQEQILIDACMNPENEEIINKAQRYLEKKYVIYPYTESLLVAIKTDKTVILKNNGKEYLIRNGQFILDPSGGSILGKGGISYSYVEEVFSGKEFYISSVYPSIRRDRPIFVVSYPILSEGEIVGCVMISPKISYMTDEIVNNFSFGKTGYLFYVDENKTIIAHKDENMIMKDVSEYGEEGEEVFNKIVNGESKISGTVKEQEKYYVSQKIDIDENNIEKNIYVGLTKTADEIYGIAYNARVIVLSILCSCAVIISYLVYILIKMNEGRMRDEHLLKEKDNLETQVRLRTHALKKMSEIDELSRLYKKKTITGIMENLTDEKNKKDIISVVIFDIDRFRDVNSKYGHTIGDIIIEKIGFMLKNTMRPRDIAGRYGGEEFLIILPNTDIHNAVVYAERIRKLIEETEFEIKGLSITASFGVAQWNDEETGFFLRKVEQKMKLAKDNGRNRVEY